MHARAVLAVASAALLGAAAAAPRPGLDLSFDEFSLLYHKDHTAAERIGRKTMYEATVAELANPSAHSTPGHTAVFGVTKYSDWSADEIDTLLLGSRGDANYQMRLQSGGGKSFCFTKNAHPANGSDTVCALPTVPTCNDVSCDWRKEKNAAGHSIMTPIKNQGECGSCWAFSGVEVTESAWIRANKPQIGSDGSLSVQRVLECNARGSGCLGAPGAQEVLNYTLYNVLPSQLAEPYTCANNGACLPKPPSCPAGSDIPRPSSATAPAKGAFVEQYCERSFLQGNGTILEQDIKTALQCHGPVAVGVDARAWYKYQSGIMRDHCADQINHAVVLAGYGTEIYPDGNIDYWIVRNSWGLDWGEDGYIRLYRGTGANTCGFAHSIAAATAVPVPGGNAMAGFTTM